MEQNTSSQSVNTSYDDVSNLTDDFGAFDFKKEEPVDNTTIVFFSLDTTTVNTNISEILQIAAGYRDDKGEIHTFKVFMMPEKYGIAPSTSVNKGYKIGYTNRKQLLLNEHEVVTSTQKEGLELFLKFLSDQSGGTRSVLLATHACAKIRRPVLLRHMAEYKLLPRCQELVSGFIDTLTIAQERLNQRVTDFSLENLAETYLNENNLQVARADVTVQALMRLMIHRDIRFTDDILLTYSRFFNFNLYSLTYDFKDVVSKTVLKRIANAGISSSMLQNEHKNNDGDVSRLIINNLLQDIVRQDVIQIINDRLLAMANAN